MKSSHFYFPVLFTASLVICMAGFSGCVQKDRVQSQTQTNTAGVNHTIKQDSSVNHKYADLIEKAHKMKRWKKKGALKTHIFEHFGDKTGLRATMYVQTDGPGIRLEIGDTVAVFDGRNMWVTPTGSAMNPFDLKTWAYFLEAPYKLNDPGTHINRVCTARLKGKQDVTAKLSFDAGIGDSPDDWFVLYRNQKSHRLDAMSYIVTYGKTSVKQAQKHPHAITYENFQNISGIPISQNWSFWHWSATRGFSDQPIGHAELKNMHFVKTSGLFSKPGGAVKMK